MKLTFNTLIGGHFKVFTFRSAFKTYLKTTLDNVNLLNLLN